MNVHKLKIAAASAALFHVREGMKIGIGTGSTVEEFIRVLACQVAKGFRITGVPTSEHTAVFCRELGIPLTTLDDTPHLDLTIDGADEIDGTLSLIKGRGGALLYEKIVAAASEKMIVIADQSKVVDMLGHCPLPIEVNRFGLEATKLAVAKTTTELGLAGSLVLRQKDDQFFITDGGHLILNASFGRIPNTEALSSALYAIPGVVEHGLFLGLADTAIIADAHGIRTLTPS